MINTIFYFVKDYDTYKQTVREQGISSRTIVFVAKERLILKEGTPYGGVGDDGLVEVFTKLMGDYFTSTISPYIFDQIAHLDLDTKWELFDEFENRINSAMSSIQLLTSQIENFISLQATRNTEMQEAIAGLNTRISTVDGRITTVQNDLIAQLSDLGDDIEDNTTAISELRQSINTVDGKVDSVTNSLTTNITNVAGDLITQRISGLVSLADLNEAMASLFAASNNSKEAPKDLLNPLWLDTPIDTTDEYPYLWMKVENEGALYYVRITNGDHTWDNVGMCVDAQFTSDPTVAEPVIHDIYESGDFYMRTKLPTETEYGEWVLISSETTFPVYSFNLSKNPATGFAQIMIDVNAEGASTVNISGDQVIIDGETIVNYLTTEYLINQLGNKKVLIEDGTVTVLSAKDLQGNVRYSIVNGIPLFSMTTGDNGADGTWEDSVVIDGDYIYNTGLHLTKLGGSILSSAVHDIINSAESLAAAGMCYYGPKWRLGFDGEDSLNPGHIIGIENLIDLDTTGHYDPKYTLSIVSGGAEGTSFGGGIYCEGELRVADPVDTSHGITLDATSGDVECSNIICTDVLVNSITHVGDITGSLNNGHQYLNVFDNSTEDNQISVLNGSILIDNEGKDAILAHGSVSVEDGDFYVDGDLKVTGDVHIGADAGITQTISIPAGTNQHYEMVIKKGIIVGCTLVDETQLS